jgi:Protein of unknown function (DUF4232)
MLVRAMPTGLISFRTSRWAAALAATALASLAVMAAATARASAAHAAATPKCTTSGLVIWLENEPGGGTAGSIYYKLALTNLSGHTCTLTGYPRVTSVDLAGRRLGAFAAREPSSHGRPLVTLASGTPTLANGTTATAVLRIVDAGVMPSCLPTLAAGLRVYPPGQSTSRVIPFPFQSCSSTVRTNLDVQALTPEE